MKYLSFSLKSKTIVHSETDQAQHIISAFISDLHKRFYSAVIKLLINYASIEAMSLNSIG